MVNNFAGAVAFEKIGWRYFLVFAVWDAFETVVIWFCAVETKGRTLYVASAQVFVSAKLKADPGREELDEIFEVRCCLLALEPVH